MKQNIPPFVNLDTNKHDRAKQELEDKSFTKINNINFIDYNNEEVINELYIGERNTENITINKLAYLDGIQENKVIRKDLFATLKDYRDISLYSNDETNEGIKIRMQREFLLGENPRLYIGNAITQILKNVEKEFVLDEKTQKFFTDATHEDERKELIFQLQKKQDKANLKLIKAFNTCDTLLQVLAQAEAHNQDASSFKNTVETLLDSRIHEVFKKELMSDDVLNDEAKKDIYNKIKFFDFENLNNLSEDDYKKNRKLLNNNICKVLTPFLNKEEIKISPKSKDDFQNILKELNNNIFSPLNIEAKDDIYKLIVNFDLKNINNYSKEEYRESRENLSSDIYKIFTPFVDKEKYLSDKEFKNIVEQEIENIIDNLSEVNKFENALRQQEIKIILEAENIIDNLSEIKKVNTDINKYTTFVSQLNSKVKMTNNFTSLYQEFNDCYGIYAKLQNINDSINSISDKNKEEIEKLKDKYFVDSESELIGKLELEKELLLRNGNSKLSSIRNIFIYENIDNVNFIQDENVKKSLKKFIDSNDFDFNSTVSEWYKHNVGSHYLSGVVNNNINNIFNSNQSEYQYSNQEKAEITQIVSKNISKMIQDNVKELKKEDGTFNASVANSIFNNFHKKNYEDIINNFIIKPKENDNSFIKDFKEDLSKAPKPNFKFNIDKSLQDNIIDVMNFNNLTENIQIKSTIGDSDEIEKIANQTINNSGLKDFAREIHDFEMNIDNARNGELKKDLPLDEHIRNLATKKYDNLANSLLSHRVNKLLFSQQTFNDFSLCVKGASVKKTSMETKLGTLDGCVQKYTQKIEQDSKELLSKVVQSQQGLGALNPFAGFMEIVAIYKQIEAKKIKKRTEQIIAQINTIAIEVGSATTDLERRARVYMVHAEDNANVYMTAVHDKEKHMLSSEFKQEYMAKAIVDAIDYESLSKYGFDYESFVKDTENLIDNNLKMSNIVLNGLKDLDNESFKSSLNTSKEILEEQGIDLNDINSYKDLENLQLNDNVLDKIAKKSSLDIKIESLSANLKLKDKKRKTIYKSDITTEQVRRLDAIQKKIVEFELNNENKSLQEIIRDIRINPDNAIFNKFNNNIKYSEDDISKYLLKEWLDENQIGYEEFENTISKGYLDIENDKNKLILKAVIENLEEQKEFLNKQEKSLIDKKQEFAELQNKFKHYDSYSKELGEDKDFIRYQKLQNEIAEIESSFSVHIRPEDRIQKTIDEVKSLFTSDKKPLEKRNILGNAINILSRSGHSVENIQSLKNCLSADTEYSKDNTSGDKSIIGFALGKKGYHLKINKESKESKIRYQNDSLKKYFEKLDYRSDSELLKGTDEENSITSLETWSNTLDSANDTLHNNQSISNTNRDIETVRETIQKSNNLYKQKSNTEYFVNKVKNIFN